MCLITLAIHAHPDYPLIIAANRDEFFARETQSLHPWQDHPIIAGRDLEAGGTWMGLSPTGRIAMVTNYREPLKHSQANRSRGELTTDFLTSDQSAETYLSALNKNQNEYQGFNLIIGDLKALLKQQSGLNYVSNRLDTDSPCPNVLKRGIFSLSNALLDTPWPKTQQSSLAMRQAVDNIGTELNTDAQIKQALFAQMRNNQLAPKANIPNTGVDKNLEYNLSSRFVDASRHDQRYGTRVSTCILVKSNGDVEMEEITFDNTGEIQMKQSHSLTL